MFFSIIKKGGLSLFIILFIISAASAQQYQEFDDYRKLSISLSGGASLGDTNQGDYFMSSNLSVNTKNTVMFGAGIQYALTSAWSVELGYQHMNIKGTSIPFKTSINTMTLKNIIHLNQIFGVPHPSSRINPFLSAGFGYDMFTYNSQGDNFSSHNSSYNLGLGLAYRLSNTLDIFSHYEYHIGSNAIDNQVAGYGADLINNLTAGVRIHFGKKDAKHLSWRSAPVGLHRSEYNRLLAQAGTVDVLQQRLDELEQRQKDKEQEFNQLLSHKSAEIDSLKKRLNNLELYKGTLARAFSNPKDPIDNISVDTETGFTDSLPGGHYVQIFASLYLQNAQDIRDHASQNLRKLLHQSAQQILIIQRKQFYEVLIGVFNNISNARDVGQVMKQIHDDTYVITFPRPINLKSDFEDLRIVQEDKDALVNSTN